jgi:hypothetical protein
MFSKQIGNQDSVKNTIKLLSKFENIDWDNVISTMLDRPMIHMHHNNMSDILDALPQEVDLLKVVNGKTAIAKIVSKAMSLDEFERLMNICKDKFKTDLNSRIGIDEDHIITFLPKHLMIIHSLFQTARNLQVDVDFNFSNKKGISLFAKILEKTDAAFIFENVEHLIGMGFLSQENLNNPLDENGNNILLLIAQGDEQQRWDLIQALVQKNRADGMPLLNINYKNNQGKNNQGKSNERLIDKAKYLLDQNKNDDILEKMIETIKILRNQGSAEPQKPITIKKDAIDKLDLSYERLDGWGPNKQNAPKIMQKMYEKFPLTDDQIDKEIKDYKTKVFPDGLFNTKWEVEQKTIPEIVDLLSKETNVTDRLIVSWSFKKVLGTIIHIERTTKDNMISSSLIYCLSDLYLCDLGKLMHLLNVVQDIVLKSDNQEKEFNYRDQDFEYFQDIFT